MMTPVKRASLRSRIATLDDKICFVLKAAGTFDGINGRGREIDRMLDGRELSGTDEMEIEAQLETAERAHAAIERQRAPVGFRLPADAEETTVEAMDRERFTQTARAAAHRATPAGQAEAQIALLERIAQALEQR